MTQVLKDLGVEYVAANPGSSFEGCRNLSSITATRRTRCRSSSRRCMRNRQSRWLMDTARRKANRCARCFMARSESSTPRCRSTRRTTTRHRSSCSPAATKASLRRTRANDMAGMVRSFTKWDAQPKTLEESLVAIQRAYNEAITPPTAPTLVVLDIELQKEEAKNLRHPSVQAAADRRHRLDSREGNCERPGRCAESAHRRRTPAHAAGREMVCRARRIGGRVNEHDGHERSR